MFESTVIKSINALTDKISELQSDVRQLKMCQQLKSSRESPGVCQQKFCLLYICISVEIMGKPELELLLWCEVLYYVKFVNHRSPSYKVKIKDCTLSSALARTQGWAARVLPLMYVYLYYVTYGFLWLVLLPFFLSFVYLS